MAPINTKPGSVDNPGGLTPEPITKPTATVKTESTNTQSGTTVKPITEAPAEVKTPPSTNTVEEPITVIETGDDGDGNITTEPVDSSPPVGTPIDDGPINSTPPPSGGPAD